MADDGIAYGLSNDPTMPQVNLPSFDQTTLAPIVPNARPRIEINKQPSDNYLADWQNRISGIESGGNYNALGPQTASGDRAYGKYQVMGANIPEWTQAALGTPLTPEQFLASKEAQDATFNHRFGNYAAKYGPEGAARAWFAGEGGMSNPNATDALGTSVADYAAKFNGTNLVPVDHDPFMVPQGASGPANGSDLPLWVTAVNYDPFGNVTDFNGEAPPDNKKAGWPQTGGVEAAQLFADTPQGPRYQFWPEKMLRSGLSLAHDAVTGEVQYAPGLRREDVTDLPPPDAGADREGGIWPFNKMAPVAAQPNDPMIERSQDLAAVGGIGPAFGEGAGKATLGSGPIPRNNLPMDLAARETRAKQMGFDTDKEWYHGTTHDFGKFDITKANPESYYGKGAYFTSHPEDASYNYAGHGPDLTGRIERLAEQKFNDLTDHLGGDIPYYGTPEYNKLMGQARQQAAKELAGPHDGAVIPAYLKMKNPINVDPKESTWLDFNAKYDGNGEWLADGKLTTKMFEGLKALGKKYNFDGENVFGDVAEKAEIYDGDVRAHNLDKALRKNESIMNADDHNGDLIGHDIISQLYRKMGFDGIVMDAHEAFPRMDNIPEGTQHAIIFRGNQIRSKFAAFDPANARKSGLLYSDSGKAGAALAAIEDGLRAAPTYSALERGLEAVKPEKAPGDQWAGIIRNMPGVKPDEAKWLNVEGWLKSQKGQVTKKDLLDYIRANQPEIKMLERGGGASESKRTGGALTEDQQDELVHNEMYEWEDRRLQELLAEDPGPQKYFPDEITHLEEFNGKWTYNFNIPDAEGELDPAKAMQGHRWFNSKAEAEKIGHREAEGWFEDNLERWQEKHVEALREQASDDVANDYDWHRREEEIRRDNPRELTDRERDRLDEYVSEHTSELEHEWISNHWREHAESEVEFPAVETEEAEGGFRYSIDGDLHSKVYETEHQAQRAGDNYAEELHSSRMDDWKDREMDSGRLYELANEHLDPHDLLEIEDQGRDYLDLPRRHDDDTVETNKNPNGTKFGNYMKDSPPGGSNYREAVITLPKGEETYKVPGGHGYGTDEMDRNRLAHVFFDDRTIDGKKYLNVIEQQSDWHHAGHEKGYRSASAPTNADVTQLEREANVVSQRIYSKIKTTWLDGATREPMDDASAHYHTNKLIEDVKNSDANSGGHNAGISQMYDAPLVELAREYNTKWAAYQKASDALTKNQQAVPDAPFKTTWPELAMKRMIRKAVDEGYDGISWVTGNTVADRYSLSKHIDQLKYSPEKKTIWGIKDGKVAVHKPGVEPSDLPNFIGRDMAQRLLAQPQKPLEYNNSPQSYHYDPPTGDGHELSDLDMKLGGSFHKQLYDNILPREAGKLVKKYGAKVETKQLDDVKGDKGQVHAIEFTPELKKVAQEKGFPLFSSGIPLHRLIQVNHDPFAGSDDRNQGPAGSGNIQGGLPVLAPQSGQQGFLSVPSR